jgi:hypothetical protein
MLRYVGLILGNAEGIMLSDLSVVRPEPRNPGTVSLDERNGDYPFIDVPRDWRTEPGFPVAIQTTLSQSLSHGGIILTL